MILCCNEQSPLVWVRDYRFSAKFIVHLLVLFAKEYLHGGYMVRPFFFMSLSVQLCIMPHYVSPLELADQYYAFHFRN